MKNQPIFRFVKIMLKIVKILLRFFLIMFADGLQASNKVKRHNPTLLELHCGEKIPLSDKYIIPDQKIQK